MGPRSILAVVRAGAGFPLLHSPESVEHPQLRHDGTVPLALTCRRGTARAEHSCLSQNKDGGAARLFLLPAHVDTQQPKSPRASQQRWHTRNGLRTCLGVVEIRMPAGLVDVLHPVRRHRWFASSICHGDWGPTTSENSCGHVLHLHMQLKHSRRDGHTPSRHAAAKARSSRNAMSSNKKPKNRGAKHHDVIQLEAGNQQRKNEPSGIKSTMV